MNREFLEFYNRELSLLREQAGEFAQEYPGVAERLGGLMADRLDPMIAGLLEGAAFLAARVQLKLKHEFADFTDQPDRSAGAALPRADAVFPARAGAAEIRRSGVARGAVSSRAAPISTPPIANSSATSPAVSS